MKKSYWPYGIAIVYGIFLLYLFGFLLFSTTQRIDLVSDDYYESGLKYQDELNSKIREAKLDNSVYWIYNKNSKFINFIFNDQNLKGKINFFRPSDKRLDRNYNINPDQNGNQQIDIKDFKKGLWRIKILWHKNGESFYKESVLVFE